MKPSRNDMVRCYLAIISWIVVFFLLTPIILYITGNNVKSSAMEMYQSEGKVNFSIDQIFMFDNLFNEVSVSGWAFIETVEDNSEKKVSLILTSENDTYDAEMTVIDRRGLKEALSEKIVPDYKTGFEGTFSPLGMKNGEYTLYIYVYENSDAYGIINTGREFRKDYHSFEELTGGQLIESDEFSSMIGSEAVRWSIDECKVVDNQVMISGWAFLEDAESSKNRVYIEIVKPDGTTSIYSTRRVYRKGLGEYFNDERYTMAGFNAHIPAIAVGEGVNTITIIVGHEYRAIKNYHFPWQASDMN